MNKSKIGRLVKIILIAIGIFIVPCVIGSILPSVLNGIETTSLTPFMYMFVNGYVWCFLIFIAILLLLLLVRYIWFGKGL
jgi:hypothetical protein